MKEKVEIEIVRHKGLYEILKDPRQLWKVMLSLFILVVVLFLGLSVVVVSVKSMYPYETVKTNPYGATILEDEDKEVIYWLFNTAELWANSGIEVKAGDVLTIRSSGKMHTAIHHLVDDATQNRILADKWIGTEGEYIPDDISQDRLDKNRIRARYRMAEDKRENVLLMKVMKSREANLSDNFLHDEVQYRDREIQEDLSNGDGYVIGKERTDLVIGEDGVLHFAVNDIFLTDEVTDSLYLEFMRAVVNDEPLVKSWSGESGHTAMDLKKQWTDYFSTHIKSKENISNDFLRKWSMQSMNEFYQVKDYFDKDRNSNESQGSISLDGWPVLKSFVSYIQSHNMRDSLKNAGPGLGEAPVNKEYYPVYNEVVYYKDHKFRDAWFVDNVGSFLIVIERRNKK